MIIIRRTLSTLVYYWKRSLKLHDRGTRILCYHRVSDQAKDYMSVSVSKFREQMKYLHENGYATIDLSTCVGAIHELSLLKKGTDYSLSPFSTKPIVITFDDGYADIYDNAFSIMKDFGFKGLVFLIADQVGKDGFLTQEHIREMASSGFEFGSHTLSHADLPRLRREEKLKEIAISRMNLEQELDMKINYFCYPKGLYDSESIGFVKGAGYLGACSNEPGTNFPENGNRFLLKRTEIAPHDSLFDFEKKLSGGFDTMHWFLHKLRGRP